MSNVEMDGNFILVVLFTEHRQFLRPLCNCSVILSCSDLDDPPPRAKETWAVMLSLNEPFQNEGVPVFDKVKETHRGK